MTGYTYDMNVYLSKDRQNETQTMTGTHATEKSFTKTVEAINSTWMIFSPLWIYLMSYTQKVWTAVELSEL
jgi:hypothetical protein